MRPVQITATAVFVAALAVTGCTSPTDQPTAATTTPSTAGSAGTTTTIAATPANARCTLSPNRGTAGSEVTLSCRGFAPSEQVAVTFEGTVLVSATATTGGDVTASFAVPSGFAGSHYPGRKDTFQAKGHQSGKVGSGTFTVTG